jgi:adenine-specific DNA-methyltransferase
MARQKKPDQRNIDQYNHENQQRVNNPPVGLVTPESDPDGDNKNYSYDPHLDPQLVWAGKAEHTNFEVPTVSLHVHERIDPRSIIEAVRKQNQTPGLQLSLFEIPEENPPIRQAIEFYKHQHNWSNRLVAGDSLLVMNSLLEKEGMAGQVQMIYFDPPYGIKYGSNFQPFVNKRDVKDGKDEDLTQEPEMIKAFRDTWELGIHSYLTYLRDRLLLARELLSESGSVFVQISDENVHHVRELMDEVFGVNNFICIICFQKTGGLSSNFLASRYDFIIWYGKDKQQTKYKQLYIEKSLNAGTASNYTWLKLADGSNRGMTQEEKLNPLKIPVDAKIYKPNDITSQGNSVFPFEYQGKVYSKSWKTSLHGLQKLGYAGKLHITTNSIQYIRYLDDFPCVALTELWEDTATGSFTDQKIYVVQTGTKTIQRCLLMTTDPGDLVLDITCLRKGTKILTPSPTLPMNGEGVRELKVPPYTGGFRRGFTGDLGEEKLIPIEEIQPGTLVYSHDQKPHRVLRTIQKQYQGEMIGLTCKNNNTTLWLTADHRVLAKLRPRSLGGNQDWSATPYSHLELRRKLRKEMTPPEQKLWDVLRGKKLEFKFRRQHPIGRYIADFYSRDAHLVVEIDGATHFEPEAIEYDRQRDSFMRSLGLDVLRFTTKEIYENLEGVCLAIESQCRIRTESIEGATWVQAGNLKPGDIVFSALVSPPNPPCTGGVREAVRGGVREAVRGGEIGVEIGVEKISLECVEIAKVENCWSTETVYDLEIEGSHSFITEVCTVHNCGSGTTAYVAEQWGRRWITCDTSRVAITLAKQRLMTATFDYYQLANSQEGVGGGFKYKTVPHITLKSIANNPEIREGMNRIEIEQAINKYADQETLYDQPLLDKSKARITGPFTVEAVPAPTVKPIDDIINPAIPDNSIALLGFDYYNTKTGNIESGSVEKIAVWMLDIDYDGRSIFPRQVFFPMAGEKDAWSRVAKNLKAEIDEDLIESYQGTVSLPFEM